MDFFDALTLFGGLAMFLYGMRLMGDALKEGASGTLKVAMEKVTNNPVKAFILGALMTALIQSSTATIVITSGLVGAGILSLHQSLGIIVGANVGTTITGQIIRLLDLNSNKGIASWIRIFQPSSLAPMALILGIILIMSTQSRAKNSRTIANIAIGFGILFSGLLNMTSAVDSLASSAFIQNLFAGLGNNPFLGYLTGAGVAFALQSSSATIGILQAFASSGLLTWRAIYAVIVGVYLGDCVTTAIVCSIGAKTDAKRVGLVNIIYNLCKSAIVLIGVFIVHKMGLIDGLWDTTVNSGIIANTNTIFNLAIAILLLPMLTVFEKMACKILKGKPEPEHKYKDKIEALSPVFFNTPAMALRSCYDLLLTMFRASRNNINLALGLVKNFDEDIYQDLQAEENRIDKMTDHVSHYLVQLLPYLKEQYHISILDQYYKVTAEFERLGDHATNIAENMRNLAENETTFSEEAQREIGVLSEVLDRILSYTERSFEKRDVEAADHIEPLVQLSEEMIQTLKKHHLNRMSQGRCNVYADAGFTNLLVDLGRIADVCSNVGIATIVRVRPELADHEHSYIHNLHAGHDEEYNREYDAVYIEFMQKLEQPEQDEQLSLIETEPEPTEERKKEKDKKKKKKK
ncbi:MAG: Na/Pi cotransporter family protein [Clostridiales bacterium]|nr:Na/Pi cotransporter family protein [Clostridiales bacterium]